MIVVGLGLRTVAIAWPGWQMPIMLAGVAMVMWAVYGLIADEEH